MQSIPTSSTPGKLSPLSSTLLLAACFGIVTGLVEGKLLWLFQNINWRNWGPTIHFSTQIVWAPVIVDVPLFVSLAFIVTLLCRLAPTAPSFRILILLLTFLAAYDWLTITGRLHYLAIFLLALGSSIAISARLQHHQDRMLRACTPGFRWLTALYLLVFFAIQGGSWWRETRALSHLPPAAPGTPNVLVIVVDTLRADHLSCYGYPQPTSPAIDLIAKRGVLFENAVSTSSWSLPSHVSLVTGSDVFEHGIANVQPRSLLDSGEGGLRGSPTISEALQHQGYRTGAFSANRTYFTANLGFGRGFAHFEDYFQSVPDRLARTFYGGRLLRLYVKKVDGSGMDRLLRYGRGFGLRKRASEVNLEVLRWIDGNNPAAPTSRRPFFAFLNYLDVHFPYGGPGINAESPTEQGREIENYDKSVAYVDGAIGSLLDALAARGILDNTIVVITSDHGESLGQHGLQFHGTSLYWELIHVPLIIAYPGHIPEGPRVASPVTNAAIPSTIMQLIGTKIIFPHSALHGIGEASVGVPPDSDVISELAYDPTADNENKSARVPMASSGAMKSLVTERWHLITHERMGDQLYDRLHDPGEQNDLSGTIEGQTAVNELKRQLQQRTSSIPSPASAPMQP